MNMASKILVSSLVIALAACGVSTQSDVDKAAHDSAASVAKARQDAQPAIDAANRDVVKAKDEANAKIADAHATANREINAATLKQSKEQNKAEYDTVTARADGDLTVALDKCKVQSDDAKDACERDAHSMHDQTIDAAKVKLSLADRQTD